MKKLLLLCFMTAQGMDRLEGVGKQPENKDDDLTMTTPRSSNSHHHMVITIDRDSPEPQPTEDIQPNRLKYKLALVTGITAVVTAGITATVTILTTRKQC